jgi:hypothetical protein
MFSDTKHDMTNGDGCMLDGYDNVCTVKPVEQTDTLLLKAINSLRNEEFECNCKCPPLSPGSGSLAVSRPVCVISLRG